MDITNNIYKQRLDSEGNAIDAEKELATKSEKEKEEEEKKKVPVPESKPGCPSCYGAGFLISFDFFFSFFFLLF